MIGKILSDQEVNSRNFEEIKANEEKYRYMFTNNPQPFLIYDLETLAFLEINSAAIHHYGYTREEFLSMTIKDIRPKEDIEALMKDVELTRNAYNPAGEWRHLKKNGEIINVEIISHSVTFNNRRARQVMINDITMRKQNEGKLQKEQYLMNILMDNIPDLIYFKDKDSRFLRINNSQANSLGISHPKLAIGKTDFDFFNEKQAQSAFDDEKTIIQTDKPIVDIEENEIFPDGRERWVSTTKMPLKDKDGKIIGTFGISRDITERKRIEETLRESERQTRALVEDAVEIIFMVDKEGYFTYINQAGINSSGYTLDELKQLKYIDLVAPEYIQRVKRNYFRQYLERRPLTNTEYPHITKSGKIIWFNQNTRLIIENGKVKGFYIIARDVTDRRIAEEALKESEERFRSLYENSTVGIYRTTPGGEIILANPTLIKLLGYSYFEEIASINLEQAGFEPNHDRKQFLEQIEMNGEIKGFESEWTCKNGSVKYIRESATAIRDSKGMTLYYDGTVEDITERKQAEEALRNSEALLNEAMNIAKLAAWEYDVKSDLFTFNDQFYKLLRTTVELEGGYTMSSSHYAKKFVYPDDMALVGTEIQKALNATEPDFYSQLDHRIICSDGEIIFISVHIRVKKDAQGRTVKTYGVNQDITESKLTEKELIEAKDKAEEMNRLKTNFLANMSHELRTPLIGILGYAEFLENELKDEELLQMAATIKTSGQRLNTTLNNILDISRIDSGKQQMELKEQDIIKYLIEQVKLFKVAAEGKGLSLNLEIKEKILNAFIDEEMFVSIISNLLSNAIKFTNKGEITLRAMQYGDKAVIEVQDTGIGVSEDYQDIIFEPFRQASEGFSRKFEGTGLGLTIVKKYIGIMGGTITVNSKPGDAAAGMASGSTFILKFPLTGHIVENSIKTHSV